MNTANQLTREEMIQRSEELRAVAEKAQQDWEESLSLLKDTHGATYEHEGQWYQIRERDISVQGRKIAYLCKLKAEPKTWLTGRVKQPKPAEVQKFIAIGESSAPETQVVPEVGDTVVMD